MHLSKAVGYTTSRKNPSVSYRLRMSMMCQCRFIGCNKCTALVGMLIVEEAMHTWGQQAFGESLHISSQFWYERKTALKKKVLKKKKETSSGLST